MSATKTVSSNDIRSIAYRIGYLSKSRIEREARKTEPRLWKLIGHASLFDNAKKYIIDHIDDDDDDEEEAVVDEWAESDDELSTIDHIEDLLALEDDDNEPAQIQPPPHSQLQRQYQYQYYQACTKCISRPDQKPQQVVVTTVTDCANEREAESESEDQHHQCGFEDWENVSDISTEGDEDDHDHDNTSDSDWSDSTCANEDHVYDASPARKVIDLCALATSQFSMPKYTPQDEDMLLWAQQPRVLSQTQADNLLVEAFA